MPRLVSTFALLLLSVSLLGPDCSGGSRTIVIETPIQGELALVGPVSLLAGIPIGTQTNTLKVLVDGVPVAPADLAFSGDDLTATLTGLAPGEHEVTVQGTAGVMVHSGSATFTLVDLQGPDECQLLNNVDCVLPYPSSRFLAPADTETGYRIEYGPNTLPTFIRFVPPAGIRPLDPTPFLQNDGFSATAHALMHFPAGVDLVASDAARIDPTTRTYDGRSLDPDSPTLLLEWESGEQVIHFVENDTRVDDQGLPFPAPDRVLTFLRPGEALLPGHRYIVAMRDLVDPAGAPVEAEAVFANIRDGGTSSIPGVEQERARLEPVLERLAQLGVSPEELVLAFDFTVMSDHNATHEMLAMRDQALEWVDAQHAAGVQTFTVTSVNEVNPGCLDPAQTVWKDIRGTFQVPLFLDRDLFIERHEVSYLMRDADGVPTWNTLTNAPFGVAISCEAFANGTAPAILLGHGLFGDGQGIVSGLASAPGFEDFGLIAGGTNWSGLSAEETRPSLLQSFIFKVNGNPDLFEALPDRLRQGMAHALVLARMLNKAHFNIDPNFHGPSGQGVFEDDQPTHYLGISLGGVMGTFHAALSPDIVRYNVDVPAINFPFLLYRSTQFNTFEGLQMSLNTDSMDQQIAIHLTGDLWTRGEPSSYVNHITGNVLPPLPGVPPKQMLVTASLYDQQVSNLGTRLLARSLRIGSLEGSVHSNLSGIPDVTGLQDSAFILYDTGALDVNNNAHLPFIAPLGNEQPVQSSCDPHGQRTFIPASIEQLRGFLEQGVIENHCLDDGLCNASEPFEINGGAATPCDPLN